MIIIQSSTVMGIKEGIAALISVLTLPWKLEVSSSNSTQYHGGDDTLYSSTVPYCLGGSKA
jgi:hypothetical protein